MGDFTGFIAYYNAQDEGDPQALISIREKENYYDPSLDRVCATNWHTIDKNRIVSLEIWWHGEKKDTIRRRDHTDFIEWVFFHTGCIENGLTKTLSRTIGVKKASGQYTMTVDEETGDTQIHQQ